MTSSTSVQRIGCVPTIATMPSVACGGRACAAAGSATTTDSRVSAIRFMVSKYPGRRRQDSWTLALGRTAPSACIRHRHRTLWLRGSLRRISRRSCLLGQLECAGETGLLDRTVVLVTQCFGDRCWNVDVTLLILKQTVHVSVNAGRREALLLGRCFRAVGE